MHKNINIKFASRILRLPLFLFKELLCFLQISTLQNASKFLGPLT